MSVINAPNPHRPERPPGLFWFTTPTGPQAIPPGRLLSLEHDPAAGTVVRLSNGETRQASERLDVLAERYQRAIGAGLLSRGLRAYFEPTNPPPPRPDPEVPTDADVRAAD